VPGVIRQSKVDDGLRRLKIISEIFQKKIEYVNFDKMNTVTEVWCLFADFTVAGTTW
jgi:hypothetical protein